MYLDHVYVRNLRTYRLPTQPLTGTVDYAALEHHGRIIIEFMTQWQSPEDNEWTVREVARKNKAVLSAVLAAYGLPVYGMTKLMLETESMLDTDWENWSAFARDFPELAVLI